MEEEKVLKIKNGNMKLYSMYKMIGLDWIFYYGIKVLFLAQVKEISSANIILLGVFYSLFYIVFSMINNTITNKIGKKESIVLGQFLNLTSMALVLISPNFIWLIVSELIHSIGDSFKGISETSLMKVTLPEKNQNGETFSKVDASGYSKFCFIGAGATLIAGFLYTINPYIPVICCMAVNVFALVLAMKFKDIDKLQKDESVTKNSDKDIENTKNDLKDGIKFVFHSRRLHTLIILLGALWGILAVFSTYQEILLKDLKIPAYYIGLILAGFQMLVGFFLNNSNKFNDKFKNHSLTYLGLILTTGSILLGVATMFNIPFEVQLMTIIFVFITRAYSKGVFEVLKNRYMNNFADGNIVPKIYLANELVSNFCAMIVGIVASIILKKTVLSEALWIIGAISTVIILILALYSKSRLGLKPEEYSKEDIEYKRG